MDELYRVEQKLFVDGDRVEHFMREVGFVDIDVRVVKIEIGDWGPGFLDNGMTHAHIVLDPKLHGVGRACTEVWSEGIVAFAQTLTRYFPKHEERRVFVEKAKQDVLNLDYHMSASLYRDLYTNAQFLGTW